MSRICTVCDKKPVVANLVSHAKNRTKRWVYPNVHTMHFTVPGSRKVQRSTVCTKCVKAGKVVKVL